VTPTIEVRPYGEVLADRHSGLRWQAATFNIDGSASYDALVTSEGRAGTMWVANNRSDAEALARSQGVSLAALAATLDHALEHHATMLRRVAA
jgi:hypothetical protein